MYAGIKEKVDETKEEFRKASAAYNKDLPNWEAALHFVRMRYYSTSIRGRLRMRQDVTGCEFQGARRAFTRPDALSRGQREQPFGQFTDSLLGWPAGQSLLDFTS